MLKVGARDSALGGFSAKNNYLSIGDITEEENVPTAFHPINVESISAISGCSSM